MESSLFLLGEEFKDLKIKFDTAVEKNDTLVGKIDVIVEKHDNLVLKYDLLFGKYEALENRFDEIETKKEETHKCNKCEERFVKRSDLQNHNKNKHFKLGKYNCEDCEKCFDEE